MYTCIHINVCAYVYQYMCHRSRCESAVEAEIVSGSRGIYCNIASQLIYYNIVSQLIAPAPEEQLQRVRRQRPVRALAGEE